MIKFRYIAPTPATGTCRECGGEATGRIRFKDDSTAVYCEACLKMVDGFAATKFYAQFNPHNPHIRIYKLNMRDNNIETANQRLKKAREWEKGICNYRCCPVHQPGAINEAFEIHVMDYPDCTEEHFIKMQTLRCANNPRN